MFKTVLSCIGAVVLGSSTAVAISIRKMNRKHAIAQQTHTFELCEHFAAGYKEGYDDAVSESEDYIKHLQKQLDSDPNA